MIFLTGDCHADYRRFSTKVFPEQKLMTKDDFVIVCGDFGIWHDDNEEKYWFKWLKEKPFTTLFVDGNHENFDRLYRYPVQEWHGGKVHFINDSIIHLMRGQVFNLQGHKFFTMGGASSHDIKDGILELDDPDFKEKYRRLASRNALFRINHMSWWKEELPSDEEYEEAYRNLAKHNNKVEFIIAHEGPNRAIDIIGNGVYQHDALSDWFEGLVDKVDFKYFIFGHYHDNRVIGSKYILLYEQLIEIEFANN